MIILILLALTLFIAIAAGVSYYFVLTSVSDLMEKKYDVTRIIVLTVLGLVALGATALTLVLTSILIQSAPLLLGI